MVVRFLLSIVLVFVVIMVDRTNAAVSAINFVILYFLYLGYEVMSMIKLNSGKY